MFSRESEQSALSELLDNWDPDPSGTKRALVRLKAHLEGKDGVIFGFKARPGVSYSLRATVEGLDEEEWPLFVMADVIDDEPDNRWLSICFYGDMITDPDEAGDLVPGGLLGKDGYCFDVYEYDDAALAYIERRIDEAHAFVMKKRGG